MKGSGKWLVVVLLLGIAAVVYVVVSGEEQLPAEPENPTEDPTADVAPEPGHVQPDSPAPAEPPTARAPVTATEEAPARPSMAERLLRTADEYVEEERFREAERMYIEVTQTHAGTDQAYSALIGAATVRLDKFDYAPGAVRFFQEARTLRPGGALDDVALWGLIRCYQKLNSPDREKKAIEEYLRLFPDSDHAADVQTRLNALSTTT